jgi:hypothetical protein
MLTDHGYIDCEPGERCPYCGLRYAEFSAGMPCVPRGSAEHPHPQRPIGPEMRDGDRGVIVGVHAALLDGASQPTSTRRHPGSGDHEWRPPRLLRFARHRPSRPTEASTLPTVDACHAAPPCKPEGPVAVVFDLP